MKKDELDSFIHELSDNSISLIKFLYCYCGICNECIMQNKMHHEDVGKVLPFLTRISYEEALKNKGMIYSGEIIAVKDSYNAVAPYINPKIEMMYNQELLSEEYNNNSEDKKLQEAIETIVEANDLSNYELEVLLNILKKNKRFREYRYVLGILKKREQ